MAGTWSWSRGLAEGTLTQIQREALQALVDDGQVDSMEEAAAYLDQQVADEAGRVVPPAPSELEHL